MFATPPEQNRAVKSHPRLHALLRARMPQRAVIADIGTLGRARRYRRAMLRLPFQSIGDVGRHGLELHVYCPSCYASRIVATDDERWRDRLFATPRFRCTGQRYTGQPCAGRGVPKIRPHDLLPVGGPATLAFLWCPRCIWEIDQAQLNQPPWSGSAQH